MESFEYRAWEQCFVKLEHCITQSPGDIATQLRPLRILTRDDIEFLANSSNGNNKKANRIVDTIQKTLERNPELFNNIFEALKAAGPWMHTTLWELQKTYERIAQETQTTQDQPHTTA